MWPHLRRRPGHSRSCQSLRPFTATEKSKRPSRPFGGEPGGGLVVAPGAQPALVISATARNNVPAVYSVSHFARDGGLLSYGPDPVDIPRRAASYVDRILRGAKPGDLPVQFPTKFEMVVNLKTAKALGLAVPLSILVPHEVIE